MRERSSWRGGRLSMASKGFWNLASFSLALSPPTGFKIKPNFCHPGDARLCLKSRRQTTVILLPISSVFSLLFCWITCSFPWISHYVMSSCSLSAIFVWNVFLSPHQCVNTQVSRLKHLSCVVFPDVIPNLFTKNRPLPHWALHWLHHCTISHDLTYLQVCSSTRKL